MSILHDRMNSFLANQEVMYIKLHNMHWFIKGKDFFTLHEKLEELYDQVAEQIDEVAERLLCLGHAPVASLKKALSLSNIQELEDKPISSDTVISVLIQDTKATIQELKTLAELADSDNDATTADIFRGYLGAQEKLLWMLEACMG